MSDYTISYSIRYSIPSVQEQIEFAVVTASEQVENEDPGTANHANRLRFASWALGHSPDAAKYFGWAVAMNPTILGAVKTDATGASVQDSDIQFVVNSNFEKAIEDWIAGNPVWAAPTP